MEKEIRLNWHFTRSPREVWEYLTRPELLAQWLMENDFQPIPGHKFRFTCNTTTYCQVLEVIPHELLSYSWKLENANGDTTIDSLVTWTLAGKDGGTDLQLVHSGFTRPEDQTGHRTGWIKTGNQLLELLNTVKNEIRNI